MFDEYKSNIIDYRDYPYFSGFYPTWTGFLKAKPNYECKPRILPDYHLVYISSGEAYFQCKNLKYSINTGDMYFLFPEIVHSYRTDPVNLITQYWVGFNGSNSAAFISRLGITPDNPVLRNVKSTTLEAELEEIANPSLNPSIPAALKACGSLYKLFAMLAELNEIEAPAVGENSRISSEAVRKAIAFMELNYPNRISINQVADHSGLSRAHFATRFKKECGFSPSEYLDRLRLQKAKLYLENQKLSIMEVAYSVGFYDALYFSRFFKKHTGMCPSDFRLLHQK
jgi:AraC-like DNA-binding protein